MKNLKLFLGVLVILTLAFTACKKNELSNVSNTAITQPVNPNPDTDKSDPHGSPLNPGDPAVGIDFGPINPELIGSYGWADYVNYFGGGTFYEPYKLGSDASGNPIVVFGFYYIGPVAYDANGNLIDPLTGAIIEIRGIDCGSTLSDENAFANGSIVNNVTTSTGISNIYNPATGHVDPGNLLEISFPKEEGMKCYILKLTFNGQVYYRRVTVS